MKKCPFCAEEILDDALKCKHCQSDLLKVKKEEKQDFLNKHPIIFLVIVFFILGSLVQFFGKNGSNSGSSIPENETQKIEVKKSPEEIFMQNSGSAKRFCRDAISKQLKAPSTAEFDNEQVGLLGKDLGVTGTVDSQNSFGAKIRSNYQCKFVWMNDDFNITEASIIK